ncbi:MAG: hypothetical protein ACOYT4_04945 [Nanoarchaeota archaeon]
MKRGIILFVAIILITNLFLSIHSVRADDFNSPVSDEEMNKISDAAEKIPLDESGEIDSSKVEGFKSNAELRIEKINQWLDNNVYWLSAIFGMRPEISWLFAMNLFLILFFLNYLVFYGDTIFVFLSEKSARIFGLVVFVILLALKIFFRIANLIYEIWTDVWYSALIKIFLILILGAFGINWLKSRRDGIEKKAKETEKLNQEVLNKVVEGTLSTN